MKLQDTPGFVHVTQWLSERQMTPFAFQVRAWEQLADHRSGLVNAPTGCGKTYSVFLGALINFINTHPGDFHLKSNNGLQLCWITPLRALASDIARAMEEAINGLGLSWKVGVRNGDTPTSVRQKQKLQMPEILIITPESLHLLLAQKGHAGLFSSLKIIAVDEWHELLGTKRGVQVELALSRLVNLESPPPCIWGISATIGNLEEAREVLLSPLAGLGGQHGKPRGETITAKIRKPIRVESIFPDEIEKFPWAGHLGIRLIGKVIPIILKSKTTLIFINTRGMSEYWYQALLDSCPDLAGQIALH
ncbi:MAG: DEAD/DEAH box helicase, partial [Bacteroidota bacterium]|nr:DEAD/DEAH box helicase [Bacteroidota bacterium]